MKIFKEEVEDARVIEDLCHQIFGKNFPNMSRAANLLRAETAVHREHCYVVKDSEGGLLASLRNWPIDVCLGEKRCWKRGWLLGPILVLPDLRGEGWGRALVTQAVNTICKKDDVLVTIGDPGYFVPMGFTVLLPSAIQVVGDVAPLSVMVKGNRNDIYALRPENEKT